MIIYKKDIMAELSKNGFGAGRLKKEKLLPCQTAQNIKEGKSISLETLNKICCMLRCQPSELIEWYPTDAEKIKYFF